jgi:hypothetical protein
MGMTMGDDQNAGAWDLLLEYKDRATRVEFSKAARYRARYKVAANLRSLPLDGLSNATAESYFVLVKLSFAYSAVEALESLTGKNSLEIEDPDFHEALAGGKLERFMRHLLEAARSQARSTGPELEPFLQSNPPKNIRAIVKHARHVVFHASITPSAIGLQGSTMRRQLILGLANATLAACEKKLRVFAKSLSHRPRLSKSI